MTMENGWHHVFGWGFERRKIFAKDVDHKHFLERQAELHERYRSLIHADVPSAQDATICALQRRGLQLSNVDSAEKVGSGQPTTVRF